MPIINCPECKNNVSDQAKVCPHCGYSLPKKSNILTILGVLLAFFIIFALLGQTPTDDQYYVKLNAYNACESYIKPTLKNPESADFDTSNAFVTLQENNRINVTLTVRATNSFNAIVPTTFNCSVINQNDSFTVESIQEITK